MAISFKERKKRFNRMLARHAMFTAYWLINRLPYSVVKVILSFLIAIGFLFTGHLRRTARESLKIAFGKEKTDAQIEEIIKKCFANFGRGMIEMIYFNEHLFMTEKYVVFEGKEHLDRALAQGKGVIAVTAHFGNFPLMLMTMARQGYPTHIMMRHTRDPEIDKFLLRKRNEANLKTIFTMPRRQAVSDTFKALRNNEIVFILMDQHFGSEGGVLVDFFGRKAATATGPVVIAQRAGAPIVPMFIRREDKGVNKVFIYPPVELEQHEDQDQMIFANVTKITKIIEQQIRLHPHEWGWMHRRWKAEEPQAAASMSAAAGEETHGDRQES